MVEATRSRYYRHVVGTDGSYPAHLFFSPLSIFPKKRELWKQVEDKFAGELEGKEGSDRVDVKDYMRMKYDIKVMKLLSRDDLCVFKDALATRKLMLKEIKKSPLKWETISVCIE